MILQPSMWTTGRTRLAPHFLLNQLPDQPGGCGTRDSIAVSSWQPHEPCGDGFVEPPTTEEVQLLEQILSKDSHSVETKVDSETLTLTANREIVIRCGEASITLTRAGKILLRGKYLLSRSSGVNRIKGGSVQIN